MSETKIVSTDLIEKAAKRARDAEITLQMKGGDFPPEVYIGLAIQLAQAEAQIVIAHWLEEIHIQVCQ